MNQARANQSFENSQKEQAWQEIMAQLQQNAQAASFEHEKNEQLQGFQDAGMEQLQRFKDAKRQQLQRFADAQTEQLQMNQARANQSFENSQKKEAWQDFMSQLQQSAAAASFEHEMREQLQNFEDAKKQHLQSFDKAQRDQLQMNQARADESLENAQLEQLQMIQAHANMANQFMQQMASAASSVADAASSMPHAVLVQQALPAFVSRPETQDMFRLPTLAGNPPLNQTLLSQFVHGLVSAQDQNMNGVGAGNGVSGQPRVLVVNMSQTAAGGAPTVHLFVPNNTGSSWTSGGSFEGGVRNPSIRRFFHSIR